MTAIANCGRNPSPPKYYFRMSEASCSQRPLWNIEQVQSAQQFDLDRVSLDEIEKLFIGQRHVCPWNGLQRMDRMAHMAVR